MIVRNVLAGIGVVAVTVVAVVTINARGAVDWGAEQTRLSVSYRGLDLTTHEGVDLLDERIKHAIDDVCGSGNDRSLYVFLHEQRCRAAARDAVRPQVDRAVEQARQAWHAPPNAKPGVLGDVGRQRNGDRQAILGAIGRSLDSGVTSNWYGWHEHGFVYASDPAAGPGDLCRTVIVTIKDHGRFEILAQGAVCHAPDGALYDLGER